MKLLNQYLYSVSKYLPYKERQDLIDELRTLIEDELEEQYQSPTEHQLEEYLKEFGSPKEVARRFTGTKYLIAPQFTDLFYLISKIILLALTIAFTIIFFIEITSASAETINVFSELIKVPLRVLQTSLQAIGTLLLVFVVISKVMDNENISMDENWDINEIKGIELEEESVSLIESIVAISFLSFVVFAINIYPTFITFVENQFIEYMPFTLGNQINIDVFKLYLIPISLSIIIQIIYYVFQLVRGHKHKNQNIYELIRIMFEATIYFIMYYDLNLYQYTNSLLGFRGIFLFAAIINTINVIVLVVKIILKRINVKL